jgi:hypothetical protein
LGAAEQRLKEAHMSSKQETEIKTGIAQIFSDENAGGLCCTLESVDRAGNDVSIQVMQDSINIAPYPSAEEPLVALEKSGVLAELDDPELEVMEWAVNAYATVGIGEMDEDEVATLVDLVFVKLLACNDAAYEITATTEDLG